MIRVKFFGIFFCMLALYTHSFAAERLPKDVYNYLQSHRVDSDLKTQFDVLFLSHEVKEGFSTLYISQQDAKNKVDRTENYEKGRNILQGQGFVFYYKVTDGSGSTTLSHPKLPGYIFQFSKMHSLIAELRNASRIPFGKLLCQRSTHVKTPHQKAYMPYYDDEECPACIVVSEFVNRPKDEKELSNEQDVHLRSIGYGDSHPSNLINFGSYIMILDTEFITFFYETVHKLFSLPNVDKRGISRKTNPTAINSYSYHGIEFLKRHYGKTLLVCGLLALSVGLVLRSYAKPT